MAELGEEGADRRPARSFGGHSDTDREKSSDTNRLSTLDRWVLVHFFTIFSVSFFVGVVIVHTSMVLRQYQGKTETPNLEGSGFLDRHYGFDSYDAPHKVGATANSSLYLL